MENYTVQMENYTIQIKDIKYCNVSHTIKILHNKNILAIRRTFLLKLNMCNVNPLHEESVNLIIILFLDKVTSH
jgi:hypothetical protein